MYHEAPRDTGEKKRHRLTPPPNEMWMEAIMSKGKPPSGYISCSMTSTNAATSPTTLGWQDRVRMTSQVSMGQEGTLPYQQFATGYAGRLNMEPSAPLYQGRAIGNCPETGQGRPMDSAVPYYERMGSGSGYPSKSDGFQDTQVDKSTSSYQRKMIEAPPAGYHKKTIDGGAPVFGRMSNKAPVYQVRSMNEPGAYQMRGRAVYHGRILDASASYRERMASGSARAQPNELMHGPPIFHARAGDRSAGMMYQRRATEGVSSKMTEDYKRDKILPPRVEEMLREQVNLDDSELHDAFAVAMEDLILEQEANFLAKGSCHLCGHKHLVPVVNFCPHADENHSLCREHLRSLYRVRMEALFVGRNGSAPNRRLLRCMICTRGCPCTLCTAGKENDIQRYRRYLLDTLRRNGQGSGGIVRNNRALAKTASPAHEGRLTYHAAQGMISNDCRRYTQYLPNPAVIDRLSVSHDKVPPRSSEPVAQHEGGTSMQPQKSESEQYPMAERNSRDGDISNVHITSTQASSIQTTSIQVSAVPTSSSPQAEPKHLLQCTPIPKRAAKETPTYKVADATQVTDPRVAARTDSPRVHQGSIESPSAATVMNCTESEKSLVQLLSSLNQSGTPITLPADTRSHSGNDSSQNTLRYGSNGAATKNGPQGIAQEPSNAEVKSSAEVRQSREMLDSLCQAKSSNPKQSLTISMDSGASPSRDRVDVDTRSVEGHLTLKRKASESEGEDSRKFSASEDVASRSDSQSRHSHERAANKQRNGSERSHHTETKHNVKPGGDSNGADTTKNQSLQPPPPLHRGPGRPRKIAAEVIVPSSSSRTEKRGSHERKVAAPSKRRGRPPKRAKHSKTDDDETEDESYIDKEEEKGEDEVKADWESELDTNLDYCEVCQGAGDLVCCDKCPRSFHLKCLRMTENDLPKGDWQCDECKKPSRFDAYSVAVAEEKTVLDKCLKIVQCLKSHPFSKQFLSPVENVPMYTKVVKQPMDLSKIENKLKKGAYIVDSNTVAEGVKELDTTHFANDVRLMWSNCKLFNDDGSGIARAADILSAGFERLYKESIAPPLTIL